MLLSFFFFFFYKLILLVSILYILLLHKSFQATGTVGHAHDIMGINTYNVYNSLAIQMVLIVLLDVVADHNML